MSTRTRARIVVASFLVVALVFVGLWVIRQSVPDRPLPPHSASVQTVAHVYLRAAEREDCGVTRALTASRTWAWCSDPRLLSVHGVGKPYTVSEGVDHPQRCIDTTVVTTGSSDGTMPRGSEAWAFCFVRTATGWRLWDQGQG
jgi:hypothetical protein